MTPPKGSLALPELNEEEDGEMDVLYGENGRTVVALLDRMSRTLDLLERRTAQEHEYVDEDEIDLFAYFEVLYRFKWWIVGCTVAMMILSSLTVLFPWPRPVFVASGSFSYPDSARVAILNSSRMASGTEVGSQPAAVAAFNSFNTIKQFMSSTRVFDSVLEGRYNSVKGRISMAEYFDAPTWTATSVDVGVANMLSVLPDRGNKGEVRVEAPDSILAAELVNAFLLETARRIPELKSLMLEGAQQNVESARRVLSNLQRQREWLSAGGTQAMSKDQLANNMAILDLQITQARKDLDQEALRLSAAQSLVAKSSGLPLFTIRALARPEWSVRNVRRWSDVPHFLLRNRKVLLSTVLAFGLAVFGAFFAEFVTRARTRKGVGKVEVAA